MFRESLGKSLRALNEEDRIAAAWAVAAGRQLAARGKVVGYGSGLVTIEVADPVWLEVLNGMRHKLANDIAQIAGVAVREICFTAAPSAKSRHLQRYEDVDQRRQWLWNQNVEGVDEPGA